MASLAAGAVPGWFRVASIVALGWNAIGVFMYLSSVGVFGDPSAGMSADQQAAAAMPVWITAAFAIGTFAGLGGALGLVLRKGWAAPVLYLSLAALILLEGWILISAERRALFGAGVPVMVLVGAGAIAWLASHARRRGWLA